MGKRIIIKQKGDWKKTHKLLQKIVGLDENGAEAHYVSILNKYGQMGVDALKAATPVDSGLTANSWGYEIRTSREMGYYSIIWTNSHVEKGWANIAILLQYGHGTRNGGYVQGRDYINPAMRPIFDEIARKIWEEVSTSE